jgi:hypothetical protein
MRWVTRVFRDLSDEFASSIYRDAVWFNKGKEILLQKLEAGQQMDVLCLSLAEEASQLKRRFEAC